jgi:hypothetical protein
VVGFGSNYTSSYSYSSSSTIPAAAATPARKQEDHPQMLTKETKVKSKQKAGLGTYPMCDPSRVF